jgi:hypothetical protein
MNIYLANLSLQDFSVDRAYLLDTARSLLSQSLSRKDGSSLSHILDATHAAFLETSMGVATLVLLCELYGQESYFDKNIISISLDIVRDAVYISANELRTDDESANPGDGCEVLYGRAGLLYTILALRTAKKNCAHEDKVPELNDLISLETIKTLVDDIVARGKAGANAFQHQLLKRGNAAPALIWSWHGKRYIGGAHGVG